MNDLIQINEQRAQFYWWMSSLFAKELTEEGLAYYQSKEVQQYLKALSQTPELYKYVNHFLDKLALQQKRKDGQLELAADFCELFLTTQYNGALPYASIYLEKSGLLNGKPALDMAKWMEKYQMAQKQEINEPFDHLALMLDFLANLIILSEQTKSALMIKEQSVFIETMLMSWITDFQKKMQQKDKFGFYLSVTNLLVSFLVLDSAFLAKEYSEG